MEDYYNYWKKELELDKKYKLKGFSRGGLRTGFMLLPNNIFLDAGVPCPIKPNIILITHGHQDHIDCLYNHLLDNDEVVQVIGAQTLINNLDDYLSACRSLNTGYKVKFDKWDRKPISDNLIINTNNTKYYIETINLDHGVECLGYGLSELRNKLKEMYKDLPGQEIAQLKKNKVEITEEIHFPVLFFCGDMNYTSLTKLPFNSYPYFIIECTFFDADHYTEARVKKHLHINDLVIFFTEHPNTKFILIHFSCRYTKSQLKEFEKIYKFDNVIFWI